MNIGTHRGKRAIYRVRNNQYTGYVFETIIDEVYVLFIFDESSKGHDAPLYFLSHQEDWNEEYAKRCYWLKKNNYELAKKKVIL